MRKHIKKIFTYFMIGVLLIPNISLAKEKQNEINYDDNSEYYIKSDGKNGNESSKSKEKNANSSTNTTTHYTAAQINASENRKSVQSNVKEWLNQVKNEESYADDFVTSAGNDAINITLSTVSADKVKALLSKVSELKKSTQTSETSYYNNNYDKSDINNDIKKTDGTVTNEELQRYKAEIVKKNHPNATTNSQTSKSAGNNKYHIEFGSRIKMINPNIDMKIIRRYINGTIPVRPDIYSGEPSMADSETYTDRYNGLVTQAEEKGWNNTTSVYMDDSITIALLTDYHIESIEKEHIEIKSYASNERKWHIKLDDVTLCDPIITDNPKHELNFTEIYKEHGPGTYYIVCEQLANVTKSTYITYSTGEYLYEADTGNILYFYESVVTNGAGGAIHLDQTESQEWVETNDTFTIVVNDLGEVETDGSATQREE